MFRTQVYLAEAELAGLNILSQKLQVPKSDLIREAIDLFLEEKLKTKNEKLPALKKQQEFGPKEMIYPTLMHSGGNLIDDAIRVKSNYKTNKKQKIIDALITIVYYFDKNNHFFMNDVGYLNQSLSAFIKN